MTNIFNLLDILEDLRGQELIEAIKDNKDNWQLQWVLKHCYSYNIKYRPYALKDKKYNKNKKPLDWQEFMSWCNAVSYGLMKSRFMALKLSHAFSGTLYKDRKWYTKIYNQDLGLDITAKDLKEIGGVDIPDFSIPEIKDVETTISLEELKCMVDNRVAVYPYVEGLRCLIISREGSVDFFNDKGGRLRGFKELKKHMKKQAKGRSFVADVIIGPVHYADYMMANAKYRFINKLPKYHIHLMDMIDIDEWDTEDFSMPTASRKKFSKDMWKGCRSDTMTKLRTKLVVDMSYLMKVQLKHDWLGYEGTLVSPWMAPYKKQDSKENVVYKLPPIQTVNATVIDIVEGNKDTNYRNSVIVRFEDGVEQHITSGVSPQFSKYMKQYPHVVLGQEAQLVYYSDNKTDEKHFLSFYNIPNLQQGLLQGVDE